MAQRAAARDIACEVAARLARADPYPAVGCAQLYAALHRLEPDAGWDRIGHRLLEKGAMTKGPAGLFNGGLADLGVAAVLLRGHSGRYQRLLEKVDAAVAPVENHDLVVGTTGLGVYFLMRPLHPKRDSVVAALVRAATDDPPFFVPPDRVPPEWSLPGGYADCGLAHGAAGPLALLALLALYAGHAPVPVDVLTRVADWLVDAAYADASGITWPAGIAGGDRLPSPRRASWCYGVPGIARALWLAGRALGETRYQEFAREAMTALLDTPRAWGLGTSPNLCHGLAGLLLVTAAFAADDARFTAPADDLLDRLLRAFDPGLPFGFDVSGQGLLTGAAGIALVLATVAAGDGDPATRPFLVA